MGLPYMTSVQKGGGVKNASNLRTNSRDFANRERGDGKKAIILLTLYMEAPK